MELPCSSVPMLLGPPIPPPATLATGFSSGEAEAHWVLADMVNFLRAEIKQGLRVLNPLIDRSHSHDIPRALGLQPCPQPERAHAGCVCFHGFYK